MKRLLLVLAALTVGMILLAQEPSLPKRETQASLKKLGVELAAAMPKDDADLPAVVESLRLALSARNPDFAKGIFNADSSVEALIRVKMLPMHVTERLAGSMTDEALSTLERYSAEGFRAKKAPLGPGDNCWNTEQPVRHDDCSLRWRKSCRRDKARNAPRGNLSRQPHVAQHEQRAAQGSR